MTGQNQELMLTECPLLHGERNADLLLDYAHRKLSPAAFAKFERHVSQCAACAAFVDSQQNVWNALDTFEPAAISPDFDRRLFARIAGQQSGPWWKRAWNWMTDFGQASWRPAIPVAAAVLLAVGLWVRPFDMGSGTPAVKMDHVDVDQLESALEDIEMLRQIASNDPLPAQQL